MEHPRDVRRRDHDDEGLSFAARREVTALLPHLVDAILELVRVKALRELNCLHDASRAPE
jgi:hypothetical protein